MKRRIRLTEGDLHRIVRNSVKKVIRESDDEIPSYEQEEMDFHGSDEHLKSVVENFGDICADLYRWLDINEGLANFEGQGGYVENAIGEYYNELADIEKRLYSIKDRLDEALNHDLYKGYA